MRCPHRHSIGFNSSAQGERRTRRTCGCVVRKSRTRIARWACKRSRTTTTGAPSWRSNWAGKRHGAPRVDVGVAVQAEVRAHPVPLRRDAQRADHAHFAMRAGALAHDGRCAVRRPATPDQWRRQKRGFVEEDQPGFQARGVFFTRGQSDLTQAATAVPSRSRARRAGFCGLQPRVRIKRPMWSMWWRTPNRASMACAMRAHVHRSVGNPAATAPLSNNFPIGPSRGPTVWTAARGRAWPAGPGRLVVDAPRASGARCGDRP